MPGNLPDTSRLAKHGVTHDRVLVRNAHVAEGCRPLWEYVLELVQQAVNAGYLAPKP